MEAHSSLHKEKEKLIAHTIRKLDAYRKEMQERIQSELDDKEKALLEEFSLEWNKERMKLETEIISDIEHCKNLINHLNSITNEVKTRAYATAERENKLRLTKEQLDVVYKNKYYELREASKRTEHHFQHKTQVQELHTQELKLKIEHLEKSNLSLKEKISNLEDTITNMKKTFISQEEALTLNGQMENLNEKVSNMIQSRSYIKEKLASVVTNNILTENCIDGSMKSIDSRQNSLRNVLINEETLLLEDQRELQKLREKLKDAVIF